MCKTPSVRTPPPPVPPIVSNTEQADANTASDAERRRRLAAGRQSTILTGPQGATANVGAGATLLGA